ncbi:hypothetical protein DR66_3871 [Delftia acidovorans]|nr:hypothetical protein DR66_3871 [Delftia acidovorans]
MTMLLWVIALVMTTAQDQMGHVMFVVFADAWLG